MDNRTRNNGWETFLEHRGFLVIVGVAMLGARVLLFITHLTGRPWIWSFVASFALMIVGGGLIGYAKLPAYRSRRFFTFGPGSVPQPRARQYRWGWRLFLCGVVLGLCLLLSKQ